VTHPARPDIDRLLDAARNASANAYAPYSHFHVGAALLTRSGRVFTGVNVENATYGATVCAERNAVGAAATAGEREIVACAVYVESDVLATPCGICRQVLAELGADAFVVCSNKNGDRIETTVRELLPMAFDGGHLRR
jgi:cytidine deaminase